MLGMASSSQLSIRIYRSRFLLAGTVLIHILALASLSHMALPVGTGLGIAILLMANLVWALQCPLASGCGTLQGIVIGPAGVCLHLPTGDRPAVLLAMHCCGEWLTCLELGLDRDAHPGIGKLAPGRKVRVLLSPLVIDHRSHRRLRRLLRYYSDSRAAPPESG